MLPRAFSAACAAVGAAATSSTARTRVRRTRKAKAADGTRTGRVRATVARANLWGVPLGQVGIWRRHQEGMGPLGEIEALGFGALWLGGSPSLVEARAYLEATTTLTVATGILNVWRHEPADVAAGHADLRSEFGERFLLGVGIGHPEATSEYKKPLAKMRDFLDGLDNADRPVPRDERVVAALGPKMLELAAERSLGTHPYFTCVEHTRFARERIGRTPWSLPRSPWWWTGTPRAAARRRGPRRALLQLTNYAGTCCGWLHRPRLADGGSDRLIDAVSRTVRPRRSGNRARAPRGRRRSRLPAARRARPDQLDDYRALAGALL